MSKRKSRSDADEEPSTAPSRTQLRADAALLSSLESSLAASVSHALSGYAGSGSSRAALGPFIESMREGIVAGLRAAIDSGGGADAGAGAGAGGGTDVPLDRDLAAHVAKLEKDVRDVGKSVLEHREAVRVGGKRRFVQPSVRLPSSPPFENPCRAALSFPRQLRRDTQNHWQS
jgi:hypothetical protein